MSTRPALRLLDATGLELDDGTLRDWARATTARAAAPFCSRSYCRGLALVGWHDAPVGVDVERVDEEPDFDPALLDVMCMPAERADAPADARRWLIDLWSSKEALTKALGDALRYDPARVEGPMRWPGGRCGPWRAERVPLPPGFVGWVVWRV